MSTRRDFPRAFKLTLTLLIRWASRNKSRNKIELKLELELKLKNQTRIDTQRHSLALIDSHQLENIKLVRREPETKKKNTERSPFDYSSLCISNCVFTNKLGEVAENI